MRPHTLTSFALTLGLLFCSWSAFGVVDDGVDQLKNQVRALQDQASRTQLTLAENMGAMKNLIEQNTDAANKLLRITVVVQHVLEQRGTAMQSQNDDLSARIRMVSNNLGELRYALSGTTNKLEKIHVREEVRYTQPGQQQLPAAELLYSHAVGDYNAGEVDRARQEFDDVLRHYPGTEFAGNAVFYFGEMEYRAGNYQNAAQEYQRVLREFPRSDKAALAMLKRAFSLIESGNTQEGRKELGEVIRNWPGTPEAAQAEERLGRLTIASPRTAGRKQ